MRWLRDLALLMALCAVGAGVMYYQRDKHESDEKVQKAIAGTRRLEMEIKYRAATKATALNYRGWPVTVDPDWFDREAPVNSLVPEDQPWLEIASSDQASLQHPPVRITINGEIAAYWYNPYQGIVRARVPVLISDEEATALYNKVNQCALPSIFWSEPVPVEAVENPEKKDEAKESAGDQAKPTDPAKREPPQVIVRRTKPSVVKKK